MKKKIILLGIIGLLLRLILMPITLHHDIWAISFSQYFFTNLGVINIYDYLASFPIESLLVKNYGPNFFTYPPLAYFTLGAFGFILKPFFNQGFLVNMIANLGHILEEKELGWHLFLTKFPYLFFDFGTLFLLITLFNDKRKKFLAFMLWVFNPLSLYTSFMVGQFDIIPIFFSVLSLVLLKRKKTSLAAISLGVGGAYKMFPLFFIPFLVLSSEGNYLTKIKLTLLGVLPFFITILPFLKSLAFRQVVLVSEQSQKILFAKIPVSGGEYLSIFLAGYTVILIFSLLKRIDIWRFCLAILLLMFSVTHYHPQWFFWATPFLILAVVEYPHLRVLILTLVACWFVLFLLFDPVLPISLFSPVNHNFLRTINLPMEINRFYDVFQFKSIIRSIFCGVSITLSAFLLRRNDEV